METKRDFSLDYLRAIGCLTMIVGHMQLFEQMHPVYSKVVLFISIGTLFFYTVSGVIGAMQVEKYDFKRILYYYSLLFLLGLSYGFLIHPHKIGFLALEIIGIIAIGSIFTAAIEYFFKPKNYVYLLIAVAIFMIKLSKDYFLPQVEFYGFLFPPGYDVKTNFLKYTSFAIFPWLFLFPLGIFMYRVKNKYNLIFFLISSAILVGLIISPYNVDMLNFSKKFDMSIGYFLFISSVSFFMFFIIRMLSPILPGKNNVMLMLGQNSLLFLFVHGFGMVFSGLLLLKVFGFTNQPLAWLLALLITIGLMKGFLKIPQIKLFNYKITWYIFIILIIAPVVLFNNMQIISTIEFILGTIFALNYKLLTVVIKNEKSIKAL